MKNQNFIFLIILLCQQLAQAQKAETIYSRVTVVKPNEYYLQQAEIWRKLAESNPQNANAWFNYYKAKRNIETLKKTDNVHAENRFKELNEIVANVNKNCPNSFEAHYLKWKNSNSNPAMYSELQKAYEIDSNRTDYFPDFVVYHEIAGNYQQKKYFLQKWANSEVASQGLLNYAYNMLIGLDSNSIIVTGGDNDTYYPWLIQEAYGIRKDVKIINIHLAYKPNVFKRYAAEIGIETLPVEKMNFKTFQYEFIIQLKQLKIAQLNSLNGHTQIGFQSSNIPQNIKETQNSVYDLSRYKNGGIYFATTYQIDSIDFEDYLKLNLVGLSFEYNLYPSGVKALNKLIQNYNQLFKLDYLQIPFYHDLSQSMVDQVNGNYLSSMFQLYEHYQNTDLSKAKRIKKIAFAIASKNQMQNEVIQLMGSEDK